MLFLALYAFLPFEKKHERLLDFSEFLRVKIHSLASWSSTQEKTFKSLFHGTKLALITIDAGSHLCLMHTPFYASLGIKFTHPRKKFCD